MHLKPARTAATAAAVGGILVLGLGSATAARANPENYRVPCNADALNDAIDNADSGSTLLLAAGCTYNLPDGLTDNVDTLTIVGYDTTLRGGGPRSDFSILTVNCMKILTLDGVNFTEGSTDDDGGAIDDLGSLYINGGIFSNNYGDDGGAVYADSDGTLMIDGAVFTGNTADDSGGAVYSEANVNTITGARFGQNKADSGGAIYVDYPTTVADSSFLGNTAYQGGGIYDDGGLTLTNVTDVAGSGNTFTGNRASQGGGIYNHDDTSVGDSLIDSNVAHVGGGIYNACGVGFSISDSTVYLNAIGNIYSVGPC
jgi:predicted outer membrane repeat protein